MSFTRSDFLFVFLFVVFLFFILTCVNSNAGVLDAIFKKKKERKKEKAETFKINPPQLNQYAY